MKSFKEIEAVLFGKCNKELAKKGFSKLERDTYSELIEIAKAFRAEEISKDEATERKLKLKEKYEVCCAHIDIGLGFQEFITTGIWNASDTVEFATFIATGLKELSDKASKHTDLSLYNEFIVQICNYLEGKMKEVSK